MNQNYEFLKGVKGINQSIIPFLPSDDEIVNEDYLNLFFTKMKERQDIWYKRNILKQEKPWTNDEIFNNYKFTNIYRELDRSSQFLIKNILLFNEKSSVEDIVFKTFVYRFFNLPDTFTHIDSEVTLQKYDNFDAEKLWEEVKYYRRKIGNPWHTAYMMNIAGIAQKPKDWNENENGKFKDYVYTVIVCNSIHDNIPNILSSKTPNELIKNLEKIKGVSSFMSHELFLDLILIGKYWIKKIIDWGENDYTNVGPGASLGIKLIFPSLQPKEQIDAIYWLRDLSKEYLDDNFKFIKWMPEKQKYVTNSQNNITLHQIEFWLCEFSKYWKMIIGEGKQRSKFTPH